MKNNIYLSGVNKSSTMIIRYLSSLILALAVSVQVPAFAQSEADAQDYPEITFEETTHNFGLFDIEHGDRTCWFKFTNTGKKELVILSASASCGCTEPTVPKTAIMPGQSDSIKVTYAGSTRRPGVFRKTISLMTNTKEKTAYLYITGEMVEKLVEDRVAKSGE